MLIRALMITHNRPEYVSLSLERLCGTATTNFRLTIWDNGSSSETREIVRKYEGHRCVEQVVYSESNQMLRFPTNWFWKRSGDAELVSKVDDDCLVPENWIGILEQAHRDIPQCGVLGCWRFMPEDFNYGVAKRKIQVFGRHRILRNCWIEGSGYLMKQGVIRNIGLLRPKESFTDYCIRASARGFVNGWYYPFMYQEHMDDPRSPHSAIRSDEDFQRLMPLSANTFEVKTREQWIQRMKTSAERLQAYSLNPYDYIGLRARIKKKVREMWGGDYFPRES